MQHDALRVVAHLESGIAGDAPHLDSLLVYVASRLGGKNAVDGYKIDRKYPCPDQAQVAIPLARRTIAGWHVALCTSPILSDVSDDRHEHFAKRIGVEHSGLIAPDERKVVTTTNGWTKSYRLPLRVRTAQRVAWLCIGDRREVLKLLRYVPAIGKKTAHGNGIVTKWTCDRLDIAITPHWPWWIESDAGPVLMRPLPLADGLPENLIGARRGYGACVDPYWHADRNCERIEPC